MADSSPESKRTRKLIEPRIQMRFVLLFLSVVCLAALVQTIVVGYVLQDLASEMPSDGEVVLARIPYTLSLGMGLTILLLTPITFALGIRTTFPIVGPLHRFRMHLTQVLAGERPGPCRIRKGDELQDFCELLNRTLEPLQDSSPSAAERSAERRAA